MKSVFLAATRLNAATGWPLGGEAEEPAQEEWGGSDPHRGGSVKQRSVDVARDRGGSRRWWQRKVVTPIMAVAAMTEHSRKPTVARGVQRKRRQSCRLPPAAGRSLLLPEWNRRFDARQWDGKGGSYRDRQRWKCGQGSPAWQLARMGLELRSSRRDKAKVVFYDTTILSGQKDSDIM